MKKIFPAKNGFTLIELLIVMAILVVVFGISFSSILQSQNTQIFSNNFNKLFSIMGNARSQAITGKGQMDFTDFDNDTCTNNTQGPTATCTFPDYVTPANYGVHFDIDNAPQIILFADINPPKTASLGEKGRFDAGTNYTQGQDVVLDSLILPKENTLKVIDGAGAIPATSSVFYSPNYADISYEDLDVSTSPFVKLQLINNSTLACRQITIHKLAGIPEIGPCS